MRSSKKPEWVAAIAAVIATCVASAMLYFYWTDKQSSTKDFLRLSVDRYYGDYKTRLYKFDSSEMPALLNTYWSCKFRNTNGVKNLTVTDLWIEQLDEKEISKYYSQIGNFYQKGKNPISQPLVTNPKKSYKNMQGNFFDVNWKPVRLPFDIGPGITKQFFLEVRLAVSPLAFTVLKDKYSFAQRFSIKEMLDFLAQQKMDFYGNQFILHVVNGKRLGFNVAPPQKEQFFNFIAKTGSGEKAYAQANWYLDRSR